MTSRCWPILCLAAVSLALSGCIPLVQSIYTPDSADGATKDLSCGMRSYRKTVQVADGVSIDLQNEGGAYIGMRLMYIHISNRSTVRFKSAFIHVEAGDGTSTVAPVIARIRNKSVLASVTGQMQGPSLFYADINEPSATLKAARISIELPPFEVDGVEVKIPPLSYTRHRIAELASFCT